MPKNAPATALFKKEIKNAVPGQILISSQEIKESLQKIAQIIAKDQSNQKCTIVGVLKGACLLVADLQRELYKAGMKNVEINFVKIKSYLSGTQSSRQPMLTSEIDFYPKDKNILIVDDIIDTGLTLKFLSTLLLKKGAASVRSLTLVSKPNRREVEFEPDYTCFEIPDVWIQGYGMDTNELGRNNPDIIIGPA
jgi:hypoxanthine phosphoribosyltransferase